jgi:DNA-binding transcriptional MerR regulator
MKAPGAFRTISEVAQELDLPQHVLRFWESRFNQIKPMKRGGGRRYYRPEDVDLLRGIRLLLYGEGFTIRGVQRLLKEKGIGFVVSVGQTGSVQTLASAERDGDDAAPPTVEIPRAIFARESEKLAVQPRRAEPAVAPVAAPPPAKAPARDMRRRLQSALDELLEAKRLLDQVR